LPQKTVDAGLIKRFSQVFRESGLTQAAFGKRIGLGQSGVGNILSGEREPSKAALRAIITEFDISPEWLLGGTGSHRKTEEASSPAGGPYVTEAQFAEWRGYWRKGMEDVLARVEALEDQVRKLNQRAGLE
jgi:transcriptional regulator with XRE-family HTH domain